MFEDSVFESAGSIHTRSHGWMVATFVLNGSILLGLVLIPLVHPERLPNQSLSFLLTAPKAPLSQPPLPKEPLREVTGGNSMATTVTFAAPRFSSIAHTQVALTDPVVPGASVISMNEDSAWPNGTSDVFSGRGPATVVHGEPKDPMRVPSRVMAGALIAKNPPLYPAIAKAAGVEGTVVLLATISKNGTIENLRVASGPALLQQAAIDAVKTWRYRPYVLNGEPVEVETTVNVVFTLGRS